MIMWYIAIEIRGFESWSLNFAKGNKLDFSTLRLIYWYDIQYLYITQNKSEKKLFELPCDSIREITEGDSLPLRILTVLIIFNSKDDDDDDEEEEEEEEGGTVSCKRMLNNWESNFQWLSVREQ